MTELSFFWRQSLLLSVKRFKHDRISYMLTLDPTSIGIDLVATELVQGHFDLRETRSVVRFFTAPMLALSTALQESLYGRRELIRRDEHRCCQP